MPTYFRDQDGWGTWSGRYSHLAIDKLEAYLCILPDELEAFLTDEFASTLIDATAARRWNELVQGLSQAEYVTMLFKLVEGGDDKHPLRVATSERMNDVARHGPHAVVINNLFEGTLADVISWVDAIEVKNAHAQHIREAIARHGPYETRLERQERAITEYPYVEELATQLDSHPNPDWWDADAKWFGPDADFETFRDHLINHWTDSPRTQGGVIARELAAQYAMNPIYDTIEEPYKGFGELETPFTTPPSYLIERFDQLRQQTQDYYQEQGVETVQLYRGVSQPVAQPSPLESWTDSREEAERYAKGDNGRVLEKKIPVDLIAFSHEVFDEGRWYSLAGHKAGPPSDPLREFAVLGGSGYEE